MRTSDLFAKFKNAPKVAVGLSQLRVTQRQVLRQQFAEIIDGGFSEDDAQKRISILRSHLSRTSIPIKPIRIGGGKDGGYILPDDLAGIDSIFSPGVGNTAEFELWFASKGASCFLADPTVEKAPVEHHNITFTPVWIGATDPNNNSISLRDWVSSSGVSPRPFSSILQCDIEGGEWVALDEGNFPEQTMQAFRYLVIEFHNLHLAVSDRHHQQILRIMSHLSGHFDVLYIAANNYQLSHKFGSERLPPVIEVTYINRDYKVLASKDSAKSEPSQSWKRLVRRNEPLLPPTASTL